jgi:rubrerythrin
VKHFNELTEREVLALAITLEEEDERIYDNFVDGLKDQYPASANIFRGMAKEEAGHRHRLIEFYRSKFGEHIPLIRREDVGGFVKRKPVWLLRPLGLDTVRNQAEIMELETKRFYRSAAQRSTDAAVRQLLNDLATEESQHEILAERLTSEQLPSDVRHEEDEVSRRLFLLQVVQPGLAGLMDGSVSTLAPLFAAAFATHQSWDTLLVGLAASIGAGISMGFAEALSDNGSLTGRGKPLLRGIICGLMTTLGGLGHSLPFLIPEFNTATMIAIAVVLVELGVISWIRHRYMETPWLSATFQVVVGGVLVFLTGVVIGSS